MIMTTYGCSSYRQRISICLNLNHIRTVTTNNNNNNNNNSNKMMMMTTTMDTHIKNIVKTVHNNPGAKIVQIALIPPPHHHLEKVVVNEEEEEQEQLPVSLKYVFEEIGNLPFLEKLILTSRQPTAAAHLPIQALSVVLERCPTLTILSIDRIVFTGNMNAFGIFAEILQRQDASSSSASSSSSSSSSSSCSSCSLREVHLVTPPILPCPQKQQEVVSSLWILFLTALSNHSPTLETVEICGCSARTMISHAAMAVLCHSPYIQRLRFNYYMTMKDEKNNHNHHNHNNHHDVEVITTMAMALQTNHNLLELSFGIQNNNPNNHHFSTIMTTTTTTATASTTTSTTEWHEALTQMLHRNQTLQMLSIKLFTTNDDTTNRRIIDAVAGSKSLKLFKLVGARGGGGGGTFRGGGGGSTFGGGGGTGICSSSCCSCFSPQTQLALLRMIQTNYVLQAIDFGTPTTTTTATATCEQNIQSEINFYLQLNREGRRNLLLTKGQSLSKEQWVDTVFDFAQDHDHNYNHKGGSSNDDHHFTSTTSELTATTQQTRKDCINNLSCSFYFLTMNPSIVC